MEGNYFMPQTIGICLGCGRDLPEAFLDLGKTPLANSYPKAEDKKKQEPFYKLAVAHCPECNLVQITHRVAPEDIFSDYLYFSSFSNAFLKHAEAMAQSLIEKFTLSSNSLVMEVGSNDGYLLNFFQKRGVPVLGIEPAKNIAKVANENGVSTIDAFFSSESVGNIINRKGKADVIIGNNVLAHVPLINDFLCSVNNCLKPTGSAIFEFPYLKDLLDKTEFDTIYHEHVFYFSLSAIQVLAQRAGLELYDVGWEEIHGGSLRVFLQKDKQHGVSNSVSQMLAAEEKYGITSSSLYASFADKVKMLKAQLIELLKGLKSDGKCIAAYGAAAKGNTLLHYVGIDRNIIDFVVDRSTYKQGRLLPGTKIPILHQDELIKRMPDYTLMLAWNFADEIIKQQADYCRQGGRFIIPIPEPRLV